MASLVSCALCEDKSLFCLVQDIWWLWAALEAEEERGWSDTFRRLHPPLAGCARQEDTGSQSDRALHG